MDSLRHVVQTESRYWSSLPLGFPHDWLKELAITLVNGIAGFAPWLSAGM